MKMNAQKVDDLGTGSPTLTASPFFLEVLITSSSLSSFGFSTGSGMYVYFSQHGSAFGFLGDSSTYASLASLGTGADAATGQ